MRFKNVVRNISFAMLKQVFMILLGFLSTRVLNHQLGEALVGVNGVIANVLGILSVSELGFSTAVVYHLYQVLEEGHEEKIAALMNLYRKAYQIIAMVIGVLGLCLLPWIHHFMKENPFSISYIRMLYGLWLTKTVCSYLLTYRRSVLIADQKEFVVSVGILFIYSFQYLAIILLVTFTKNYLLALTFGIVFEMVVNIILNRYVDRHYPYLRVYRKEKISENFKKRVFEDIKNIFFSNLSLKMLVSTDNLVISSIIGVVINGLYNNYGMITNSIYSMVLSVSKSLQPTVGNMFIEKDQQKNYQVFRQISFCFFLITAFIASGLFVLMTPFVRDFWLGENYILDEVTVSFLIVCSAVTIMGNPLEIVMGVSGLFRIERNLSLAASGVNIVLSILLGNIMGLPGVVTGTITANTVCIIVRAYVFFHRYLRLPMGEYLSDMLSYVCLIILEVFLTVFFADRMDAANQVWDFFLSCGICLLVPNGINLLLFSHSWRLRSVLGMVTGLIRKKEVNGQK